MARLLVKYEGKLLQEIYLNTGKSYLAGRKEDCDIPLLSEKSISREHFKLSFQDGNWVLEVLSRFGDVLFQSNKVQNLILDQSNVFRIPPYEFEFDIENQQNQMIAVASGGESFQQSDDRTYVGRLEQIPFIKLISSQDKSEQLLRLDGGDTWLAGRDPASSIPIKDQRVSRRQFEIRKLNGGYGIIDLGSVNGTLVNGNNISTSEVTQLRSGDAITVLDNTLYFELHDPQFMQRVQSIDYDKVSRAIVESSAVSPADQMSQQQMSQQMDAQGNFPVVDPGAYGADPYAQYAQQNISAPVAVDENFLTKIKENKIRVLIAVLGLVLVVGIIINGDSDKKNKSGHVSDLKSNPNDPFNKLKKEQQILIKQSFQLAQNYYDNDNSELCRAELTKIREIMPDYKKSYWGKEIDGLDQSAEQKIYILLKIKEDEAKRKILQEQEAKIQEIASLCKSKLNPNMTRDEFDTCVSPAITIDPNHPQIASLRAEFDNIDMKRTLKVQQTKELQEQAAKLQKMFSQAEKTEKQGDLADAIEAYKKVVSAKLSDPNSLKAKAQKNLTAIREKIGTKTSTVLAEAEKLVQAKNFKQAILNLRMAKKVNPQSDEINERIDLYVRELRKEMKTLWDEAIIEESFGKVMPDENNTGAIGKWKKIIELDIVDGDFYQKAKIKLKKYGAN